MLAFALPTSACYLSRLSPLPLPASVPVAGDPGAAVIANPRRSVLERFRLVVLTPSGLDGSPVEGIGLGWLPREGEP
jgi:hypothetical protein